jgi:hypothetical protein
MVQDMDSFISNYSSTVILAPHAIRFRVTEGSDGD